MRPILCEACVEGCTPSCFPYVEKGDPNNAEWHRIQKRRAAAASVRWNMQVPDFASNGSSTTNSIRILTSSQVTVITKKSIVITMVIMATTVAINDSS